ncbi:MAG TPA: type II secretion system F family protein, partial [Chitinophagaceae bacterium]|nr:type II secretion system F family protein [Chitinophagaceae bacterium]
MPDYNYVARDKEGNIEKNIATGVNEKAVVESLRARGLVPTSIKEVRQKIDFNTLLKSIGTIRLIDKITFIKNLAVMVKSGLPVSKSLKILSQQTTNKKFAVIVGDVSRAVESGSALAEALAKYPNVFSNIFVSMVKVGEVSGNLEQNLHYLSEQLQRDYDLISKAKGAMTYPIVVMIALVLVTFAMFTFVLPKMTATFKEFDVELPIMTKIVIGLVDIFAAYGLLMFPAFIGLIVGFFYWKKTANGKAIVHRVVLYIPVFGKIVKQINLARFLGVFSSLMKSGMSIVDSLAVSTDVVGNVYYKKVIAEGSAKVKVGSPLTAAFKKRPDLFDPLIIQMMEVG